MQAIGLIVDNFEEALASENPALYAIKNIFLNFSAEYF